MSNIFSLFNNEKVLRLIWSGNLCKKAIVFWYPHMIMNAKLWIFTNIFNIKINICTCLKVYGKTTYEWHTDGIRVHTSDIRMTYEYIRVTYGWHTSTYCFGLFTKIKKGSGISFWCTFSVWVFHTNAPYLILYQLTKFQRHIFLQDIKRNVLLSSYWHIWWRHKL